MTTLSSTEVLSSQLEEIVEKPRKDTPRSIMEKRRAQTPLLWAVGAFVSTSFIQATRLDVNDQFFFTRSNSTAVEEGELEETFSSLLTTEHFSEQELPHSEAEAANRTRLELLARQYAADKLSVEEEARLMIVTERVRRLIPRVTTEDFKTLEEVFNEVAQMGLENIERRQRLGIN